MVQTYNEFKVVFNNKGEVIDKRQTERGTVRISEGTAATNNFYSNSTRLIYELVPEVPKEKTVKELKAYIIEMEYDIDLRLNKEGLIAAINEIEKDKS